MLYGSETWAVKEEDLDHLDRNDMRMIRWMCNTSLKDRKSSDELRSRLSIHSIRCYSDQEVKTVWSFRENEGR